MIMEQVRKAMDFSTPHMKKGVKFFGSVLWDLVVYLTHSVILFFFTIFYSMYLRIIRFIQRAISVVIGCYVILNLLFFFFLKDDPKRTPLMLEGFLRYVFG